MMADVRWQLSYNHSLDQESRGGVRISFQRTRFRAKPGILVAIAKV